MDMDKIIGLALGLIVAAAILPTAVVMFANLTLWEGAPAAVLTLIPVVAIISVVALVVIIVKSAMH